MIDIDPFNGLDKNIGAEANPLRGRLQRPLVPGNSENDYLRQSLAKLYPNILIQDVRTDPFKAKVPESKVQDRELYKSYLGTPVYSDIEFKTGAYKSDNGIISFRGLKLQTALITIDQTKNIIETPIQGRNGTVKEYIGLGDYNVTIDGIILGTNSAYPLSKVGDLKEMVTAPIAIQVISWFLQLWDINYLVVKGFDIPQEEGSNSLQRFTLNCLSDNPVQLRLLNAKSSN